jgi:adenylate cyclase
MSDIFISYARSTEAQAQAVAEAVRALGYEVWRDDELPAHRAYTEVIEERLRAAKAVVVIWSAEAVKSQWVRAEADVAREAGTLVQLSVDGATLPLPFNQIQCANLAGWTGDLDAPGWRKVVASVADLVGGSGGAPEPVVGASVADAPLPLPSKPSIAVMPFVNLSGDPEQAYFVEGMVEEIVAALTRNRLIFVIASGSTAAFRGQAATPQAIGRELGVRYILEGNVRQAGGHVRIAVKLIDTADGAQIWSQRFDDTLEDVFALQDSVALSVAGVIEPTLQDEEFRRVSKRPTENMSSYDLYLRAMSLFWKFDAAQMAEAYTLLERAIGLDRDFGIALAAAATCLRIMIDSGWSEDPVADRERGLELARRALKSCGDDARALAHIASALVGLDPNPETAEAVISRAVTLNPGCAYAWLVAGIVKARSGATDAAAEDFLTAKRLDPRSPMGAVLNRSLAVALFGQRRFSEALVLIGEVLASGDPVGYAFLASTYGHLSQLDQARSALAEYRRVATRPIEQVVAERWLAPEIREMFMDGIALADGKTPADTSNGG